MDIELYKADKLSQKGSSLRSMIMNKDMPVLDLLVRESLQNSLDAKDTSSRSKFVNVDYVIDSFNRKVLDKELKGISLEERPEWGNRFIAIRDSYTTGLTGTHDDKGSNLYKLVYGIMEAQQASGAGGSWGIGKTVYFRIGVGLVLYYSRVRVGDGFEELLAADLVEDERSKDAILPPVAGKKYGIAWWGEKVPGKKSVKETRNPKTIARILKAFGLEPYTDRMTGTSIIIPFIDEQVLLKNNLPDNGSTPCPWTANLQDYIRISVQRWYSARLSNKKYKGKILNVAINGKGIKPSDMDPFFKLTQALYNKAALTIARDPEADNVEFEDADIRCEEIRVNSEIYPNEAGRIAFTKVSRKILGMVPPLNCPSPYEYISSLVDEDDFGKPVIMFCRKPGVVVSYELEGKWVSGIPDTSEDEFLVGFFVLNSEPALQNIIEDISLEDYVRKSELADHTSWEDCDMGGVKPTIISKIKKSVIRKLSAAYEEEAEEQEKTTDNGLSTLLGRLLLPPEGFGKKPSNSPSSTKTPGTTTSHKNVRYSYFVKEFKPDGMVVELKVSTGKRASSTFGFEFAMDSVTGPISASAWEADLGLEIPFAITGIEVATGKIDHSKHGEHYELAVGSSESIGIFKTEKLFAGQGDWIGAGFSFADAGEHSFELVLTLHVSIRRKDIKPVLSFDY